MDACTWEPVVLDEDERVREAITLARLRLEPEVMLPQVTAARKSSPAVACTTAQCLAEAQWDDHGRDYLPALVGLAALGSSEDTRQAAIRSATQLLRKGTLKLISGMLDVWDTEETEHRTVRVLRVEGPDGSSGIVGRMDVWPPHECEPAGAAHDDSKAKPRYVEPDWPADSLWLAVAKALRDPDYDVSLPLLRELAASEAPGVKDAALQALVRREEEPDRLREMAEDANDPARRRAAAEAIGRLGLRGFWNLLVGLARGDDDEDVQRSAVASLRRLATPGDVDALRALAAPGGRAVDIAAEILVGLLASGCEAHVVGVLDGGGSGAMRALSHAVALWGKGKILDHDRVRGIARCPDVDASTNVAGVMARDLDDKRLRSFVNDEPQEMQPAVLAIFDWRLHAPRHLRRRYEQLRSTGPPQ